MMMMKGNEMSINEYLTIADQIDAIIDRAVTSGPFTKELTKSEILERLWSVAFDLRNKADQIDREMSMEATE